MDNLQVGEEVAVPEVKGDEEDGVKDAGTNNGFVLYKLPWNEGLWTEELLVDDEKCDGEEAEDEEAQNGRTSPSVLLVTGEGEGEEEDSKANGQKEDTYD